MNPAERNTTLAWCNATPVTWGVNDVFAQSDGIAVDPT
jgi:hypothetical protein